MARPRSLSLLIQSLSGEEVDYTRIGVRKAILLLSIPMVLELSMESLFALVDVYFVGRVGTAAVAAVGLTESVLMILYSIAWGTSMGVTAVVARRTGEKDREGAAVSAAQGLWIALAIGVAIGIPTFWFAPEILTLMGGSPDVLATGTTYARILFGGNVVIMLLFVINAIFRGAGSAVMAMLSLVVANFFNILLDPLLIFGIGPFPEMGVTGAAVATTIGRGIGVAFQLWFLFRGSQRIRLDLRHLKVVPAVIRRIVEVSIGGVGQFLIASASWVFLVSIVARFGDDAVAGYTIAVRIIIFSLLPSWGMANSAATLVGQNLGAGYPDRAERSAWLCGHYNMVFMVFVALIFWTMSPWFIDLFTSDPAVARTGVSALRIICLGYFFYGYGMVLAQAFNGAGDTVTPTWMNVICFWLLEIPLGWSLAMVAGWGPQGVFAAVAVAESALAVLSALLFRRGRWKLKKV